MLPDQQLEADLRDSLAALARQPLAETLLSYGILRKLASDHLLARLRETVIFSPEEEPLVISRLWQGFPGEPPAQLAPGWLQALDPMLQGPIRDRWDQIRQQKWMEVAYRDRVEPYFLERRDDLEQVVYGMIRLRNQGAAEELYLRLLDDQADFGDLAKQYSLGEERFTRGLVGPMLISQPHPTIRSVLQSLAVDELHPPFRVDNWILLVRMEHRQPARLNDATLLQLSQELLQKDLDAQLDARLAELYPALLAAFPPVPLERTPAQPERADHPAASPNQAERHETPAEAPQPLPPPEAPTAAPTAADPPEAETQASPCAIVSPAATHLPEAPAAASANDQLAPVAPPMPPAPAPPPPGPVPPES